MTMIDIARKDFADAVRSKALWASTVIFLGLMILTQVLVVTVIENPNPELATRFLEGPAIEVVLPIVGLIVGYQAVVGERETGNIKFLLGFPHSRLDVVVGMFIGRFAVLSVAILSGFLGAVGIIIATLGIPSIVPIVTYILFVLLSTAAIVSIAIGVSAVVTTRGRAISIVVGGYIFATMLWSYVVDGAYYAINGKLPGPDPPTWVAVLDHLNPLTAMSTSANVLLPKANQVLIAVTEEGISTTQDGQTSTEVTDILVYEPLFLAGVLVLWTLLPLAVGYLRFRDADLS